MNNCMHVKLAKLHDDRANGTHDHATCNMPQDLLEKLKKGTAIAVARREKHPTGMRVHLVYNKDHDTTAWIREDAIEYVTHNASS